ncbi:MAG: hypothetical protein R3F60_24690 [bacterium]
MDSASLPTRIDGITTLTVSADAEIMQSYQAALPVAANHTLAAVQDSAGNPLVFSIGSDQRFYLLLADPGGPTGWTQLDLTDSVSRWGTPTKFAVGQVPSGDITLVVAATPAGGGTPTVVIAGPLSCDPTQTDWTQLSQYWVSAGNPLPSATLDSLYVGPVDASGGYNIPLVAVGYQGGTPGAPNDYLLQPHVTAGISWSAVPFPTPTDSAEIHDYAMGVIGSLGVGLYMLYDNTLGESILVFKTLPNSTGNTFVRELSAPAGATCLETTAAAGATTTDLYVGGSGGIYHFSPDQQGSEAQGVCIAGSDEVPAIAEGGLIVRQDGTSAGTTAIWALSGENLVYFHSSPSDPGGYSKPVLFEAGVAEVAPIRSQSKQANQLVFVKTDVLSNPAIIWMWQDPQSSLWQRDSIPLQSSGETSAFNCYSTTLTFTDQKAQPRPGLAVSVQASGWTRVIINGVAHLLDVDAPVTVTTDLLGTLTLINPVADLATPRFVLTAANPGDFDGALVVEPAYKVYSRLQQVQSGADIPDYVLAKLPAGVTKDQVAEAISKLTSYQPDPAPQGSTIVYQASAPTAQLAVASPKIRVPANHQAWRMEFGAPKTLQLNVVGEVWDGVTNLAGDLWQFATSVIEEVVAVTVDVVESALTFVVELVGKTIQIVIQTLEDVFKAIAFILQKVAAVIEDVIKWLGFLFDWQDMWDAHLVLANFITSGVTEVLGRLDAGAKLIEDDIYAFFEQLKKEIHSVVLPDDVANTTLQSQQAAAASSSSASMSTTTANWTLYQVQHGGVTEGTTTAPSTDDSGPSGPIMDFFNDVLVPTLDGLKDDFEQLFDDIGALFKGSPTMAEFLTILTDVADTFLDAVANILAGCVEFTIDVLKDIGALITETLEIPFFSSLYRFVTKLLGQEEDLSIVNVVSLIVAIPATILYKAGTGQSPFPNGIEPFMDPKIFAQMLGPRPTLPQTTMFMAVTTDDTDGDDDSTWDTLVSLYTHLGALVPAILVPIGNILAYVTLDKQLAVDGFYDEATPLSASGKDALKKNIGFLEKIQLACSVGSLMFTVPIPKHQSAWADWLAGGNWGLAAARTAWGVLLKKVPGPGATRKLATAGGDAVMCVAQSICLLAGDIIDSTHLEDGGGGLTVTEDIFKYFQDLCTCGGNLVKDAGIMASAAPSGALKLGANAAQAGGIVISGFGSAFLVIRVFLSVGAKVEKVMRVSIS